MRTVRLYPLVKVQGKKFTGVVRSVVPNQSMSLREIIKRFVRRESLPVSHEGIYSEGHGDLEKLSRRDISEIFDDGRDLRARMRKFEKDEKERLAKEKKERIAAKKAAKSEQTSSAPPVQGGTPLKSPPLQGS